VGQLVVEMSGALKVVIAIQATTFIAAAILLIRDGANVKLGFAQALLAIITWLVYA
jgi:hypothetical protein